MAAGTAAAGEADCEGEGEGEGDERESVQGPDQGFGGAEPGGPQRRADQQAGQG